MPILLWRQSPPQPFSGWSCPISWSLVFWIPHSYSNTLLITMTSSTGSHLFLPLWCHSEQTGHNWLPSLDDSVLITNNCFQLRMFIRWDNLCPRTADPFIWRSCQCLIQTTPPTLLHTQTVSLPDVPRNSFSSAPDRRHSLRPTRISHRDPVKNQICSYYFRVDRNKHLYCFPSSGINYY